MGDFFGQQERTLTELPQKKAASKDHPQDHQAIDDVG
jgi:hypothetical protein